MELIHLELLPDCLVCLCSSCRFPELFKFGKVALLLSKFHAIGWRQLTFLLLLQTIDSFGLVRLRPSEVKKRIHLTLIPHEVHHVPLYKRHAQYFEDLRTLFFILV